MSVLRSLEVFAAGMLVGAGAVAAAVANWLSHLDVFTKAALMRHLF
ncbi:MAG TPA: hypothetical protein VG713_16265 [Pirellulales bacterium]|nr:hypothetical protein [Pirellulales bacterium]